MFRPIPIGFYGKLSKWTWNITRTCETVHVVCHLRDFVLLTKVSAVVSLEIPAYSQRKQYFASLLKNIFLDWGRKLLLAQGEHANSIKESPNSRGQTTFLCFSSSQALFFLLLSCIVIFIRTYHLIVAHRKCSKTHWTETKTVTIKKKTWM